MAKTHTQRGSFPTLVGTDTKALAASRIETKRAVRSARVPGKGKLILSALALIADAANDNALRAAVARFDDSVTEEDQREAFALLCPLFNEAGFGTDEDLDTLIGGLGKLIDKRFPAE